MKFHIKLKSPNKFENQYLSIRKKERRILTIDQIKNLPITDKGSDHHQEWKKRVSSTARLKKHVFKQKENPRILEIGCGNGWLLNQLAINSKKVVGIDLNLFELEQAQQVLSSHDHAELYYANLFELDFRAEFDFIIFGASIQYFQDLNLLFDKISEWLVQNGEILIFDSPIYHSDLKVLEAQKRSASYFDQMNQQKMREFYFHHSYNSISPYTFRKLYDPQSYINRVRLKLISDSPFPFVSIKSKNG